VDIQGIYEYVIGTSNPEPLLRYWAEFGYRPVIEGSLPAAEALALYGVESGLTSFRLQNGEVGTHGLIRLMVWDVPPRPGLGNSRPLTVGSRWLTARTNDILYLRDTFMDVVQAGEDWRVSDLIRQTIREGQEAAGFYRRFVGVREMMVVGPETRQVFFQRYGYDVPGYGTINANSALQVSEGTHGGIVVPDLNHLDFYTEVFGLELEKREVAAPARPDKRVDINIKGNTLAIGPLMRNEGESYQFATLVTPAAKVGRLYVIAPESALPDMREQSRPGVAGMCLATYRVAPVGEYYQRVKESGATELTSLLANEFGEASFTFKAPDGIVWGLIGNLN
jgi:uncharacterized glyoxalase superfamily protein PhnB